MADGVLIPQWHQTALLATILANSNRDEKKQKKPFELNDFLPPQYRIEKRKQTPLPAPITVLKAFVR